MFFPCLEGVYCSKQEDDSSKYYKILSQFKDLDINVLESQDILEILKSIKDLDLRSKIIE